MSQQLAGSWVSPNVGRYWRRVGGDGCVVEVAMAALDPAARRIRQ
jgi:hypothetical protein